MNSNGFPYYEPDRRINQRNVRPGVWLFVAGSLVFLFVLIIGLSFVEPIISQGTVVESSFSKPIGPWGTALHEDVNPASDPLQTRLNSQEPILLQDGNVTWQMNPRAAFIIAARVVGNKEYRDWQATFAPFDLLLAWGDFSNPEVDQWITWRQSGRGGRYYQTSNGPFTGDYIISHASNVHIIPASENLEMAVNKLKRNEIVLLEGLLVDIKSNKGNINTSLTRTDSSPDSCEILYVQRLVVDGTEYR